MKSISFTFTFLFISVSLIAQPVTARLDSVMDAYQKLNWNATLIVGKDGREIYRRSIGYADVDRRIPLRPDAVMQTASTGKMFTATRILQLVHAGKLHLSDTVQRFLPEWNIRNLDRITIHQLLTHTSGLASPWDHPGYDFKKRYTRNEMKQIMEEVPLTFANPGERSSYSNIGYQLLGEIIARLDGMPFEKSIEKHLFEPAGIAGAPSLASRQLAVPYYQVSPAKFVADNEMMIDTIYPGSGAGGWMLGAPELFRFLSAWQSGSYLDEKWRTVQVTANGMYTGQERNMRYGLAVLSFAKMKSPGLLIGHNGGGKGFSADAYTDMQSGYTVVMLSNQWGTGYALTANSFRVLNNEPVVAPVHSDIIRLADFMQKNGYGRLSEDPGSFFKQSGIGPSEFLLTRTYENFVLLKDYPAAAALMDAGRKLFPNSSVMWVYSGDNAADRKDKKMAREYYTVAKRLSMDQNDAVYTNIITKKIESL